MGATKDSPSPYGAPPQGASPPGYAVPAYCPPGYGAAPQPAPQVMGVAPGRQLNAWPTSLVGASAGLGTCARPRACRLPHSSRSRWNAQ